MKELLYVSIGSFIGGGCRYLISQWCNSLRILSLPIGTMMVNICGCFLIGLLINLPIGNEIITPRTKLFLTTGFCGGLTTFSTFMVDNTFLIKEEQLGTFLLYMIGSLCIGYMALLLGQQISKLLF